MISTQHPNAQELFDRDVMGLVKYFAMKQQYVAEPEEVPSFESIVVGTGRLDEDLQASGFRNVSQTDELHEYFEENRASEDGDHEEEAEERADSDNASIPSGEELVDAAQSAISSDGFQRIGEVSNAAESDGDEGERDAGMGIKESVPGLQERDGAKATAGDSSSKGGESSNESADEDASQPTPLPTPAVVREQVQRYDLFRD